MRSQKVSTFATWLTLVAVPVAAGPTWWVDKSCAAYWPDAEVQGDGMSSATFDKLMAEVVSSVKMGYKRMSQPKSKESAANEIYEALFKHTAGQPLSAPEDPNWNEDAEFYDDFINKVWGEDSTSMQQWQKGDVRNGRPSSDLRIYCDNDERFKEMDPKDEPKGLPTSKDRSDDEKYYVDSINKIKIKGLPSCHGNTLRTDNRAALASTSGGKSGVLYKEAPFDSFSRVSVTICDYLLKKKNRHDLMGSLPEGYGLLSRKAEPHIDQLRVFTSMTMLHEMHHHSFYKKSDHAYDWKPSVALVKEKAVNNADSYAMFGVAMRGLDQGFKVDVKTGDWKKSIGSIPKTGITKRGNAGKAKVAPRLACRDSGIAGTDDRMCREFTA